MTFDKTLIAKATNRAEHRRRTAQYPDMRALRTITKALAKLKTQELRLAVLEMARVRVNNWDQIQPSSPMTSPPLS